MPDERKTDEGREKSADKSRGTVAGHFDRFVMRFAFRRQLLTRAPLHVGIGLHIFDVRKQREIVCRRRRRRRPFERPPIPGIAGDVAQFVATPDADHELDHLADRAAQQDESSSCGEENPRPPFRRVVMLQPTRHAEETENIERHESDVETHECEPERRLAPTFVQAEPERLGKPIGDAGHHGEHDARHDHMVEMRDKKHAVVQEKSAGGTASSTPVIPPVMKVSMKPSDHSIGVA